MILRRLGSKAKISMKIQQYFPKHDIYIEPFFGCGGMFFSKPKAKHNICNDLDGEIFNLYTIIQSHAKELIELIDETPLSEHLFEHWKVNKETEPLRKALRFLCLTNLSFGGLMNTFSTNILTQDKENFARIINNAFKQMGNTKFLNKDFRELLKNLNFPHGDLDKVNCFIYADPPYIGTNDTFEHSFTENDTMDLFEILNEIGIRFMISEFDTPFILGLADKYKLNVITLGERKNLMNKRTEILITNYENAPTLFS